MVQVIGGICVGRKMGKEAVSKQDLCSCMDGDSSGIIEGLDMDSRAHDLMEPMWQLSPGEEMSFFYQHCHDCNISYMGPNSSPNAPSQFSAFPFAEMYGDLGVDREDVDIN